MASKRAKTKKSTKFYLTNSEGVSEVMSDTAAWMRANPDKVPKLDVDINTGSPGDQAQGDKANATPPAPFQHMKYVFFAINLFALFLYWNFGWIPASIVVVVSVPVAVIFFAPSREELTPLDSDEMLAARAEQAIYLFYGAITKVLKTKTNAAWEKYREEVQKISRDDTDNTVEQWWDTDSLFMLPPPPSRSQPTMMSYFNTFSTCLKHAPVKANVDVRKRVSDIGRTITGFFDSRATHNDFEFLQARICASVSPNGDGKAADIDREAIAEMIKIGKFTVAAAKDQAQRNKQAKAKKD